MGDELAGGCACCGCKCDKLEAHEVWDFDISTQTQTLVEIVALCAACHGVKHMGNSQRIGYGAQSKAHFCKVNKCDCDCLTQHYIEAEHLFNERSKVKEWIIKAPLLDELGIAY